MADTPPVSGGKTSLMKKKILGLPFPVAIGIVAVLGFLVYRHFKNNTSSTANSSGSSASPASIDPNAIDPNTGLTYGAEEQAGLAQVGGAPSTNGTGTGGVGDGLSISDLESLIQSLEGFHNGGGNGPILNPPTPTLVTPPSIPPPGPTGYPTPAQPTPQSNGDSGGQTSPPVSNPSFPGTGSGVTGDAGNFVSDITGYPSGAGAGAGLANQIFGNPTTSVTTAKPPTGTPQGNKNTTNYPTPAKTPTKPPPPPKPAAKKTPPPPPPQARKNSF